MTNQEAVQDAIESTSENKMFNYFVHGLGYVLFADGGADIGCDILEKLYSITTTRDFSLTSAIEMAVGFGFMYVGFNRIKESKSRLSNVATKLNEHYVKD